MKGKVLIMASVAMMVSVVFYGAGCNPFQSAQEKASEKLAEKMLESMAGGDVDIDLKKDGAVVKVKDEQGGGEMYFGEDVAMPDDLKDTVLTYQGAQIISVIKNLGGSIGAMVSFRTGDDTKKVIDWYEDQYTGKGWIKTQTVSINNAEMRGFEKDNLQLLVTVGPDEEEGGSVITVSWSEEN
jgi:hypothetical protein